LSSRIGNNAYDGDSMMQVPDYFNFRNAQTIIVTGVLLVWGWMHFFHDRDVVGEEIPSVEISHEIFSTCLNEDNRLVRVKVEVRNVGAVELKLSEIGHSIAQVSPFAAGRDFDATIQKVGSTESEPQLINWPKPAELIVRPRSSENLSNSPAVTVQPNETHEQYHDFVITPSARVIELTSTFDVTPQSACAKIENCQAKTIYDVGVATCPQLPAPPVARP
jgi:hypothetical protein